MKIPKSSISITLEDVRSAMKGEKNKSKNFHKELKNLYEYQSVKESEFLSNYQWKIPPKVEGKELEEIEKLVTNAFTKSIHREDEREKHAHLFLNGSSLEDLSYVAKNIVIFDGPQFRTGYSFIKKIITDVRLIGSPSADGYAMTTSMFSKYKDLFVIKAPRNPSEKYSKNMSNHELAVGKILNSIRPIVPNFVFTVGSFDCGPPIVSPEISGSNAKLISWCRGGTPVKYIIYENISGGQELYDYLHSCTTQEFMDLIVQLNYALMTAFKAVGFTHYDLHTGNIIVRKMEKITKGGDRTKYYYIPYNGDFVRSTVLATIIDYGRSHAYFPETKISLGVKFGGGPEKNVSRTGLGFYMDRPFAFRDCFFLLIKCLGTMKDHNKDVYERTKNLMNFFIPTSENIDECLDDEDFAYATYFGSADYMDNIKKFKYENFIKYCREYCIFNNFKDPVLSGREYTDEIDEQYIFSGAIFGELNVLNNDFFIDTNDVKTVENIFDLIEPILIYTKYIKSREKSFDHEKAENHKKIILKIYDKIMAHKDHYHEVFKKGIAEIRQEILNLKTPLYQNIPENVVLLRNRKIFDSYIHKFENVIKHVDKIDELERKYEMLEFVEKNIFGDGGGGTFFEIDEIKHLLDSKDVRSEVFNAFREDVRGLELFNKNGFQRGDEKIYILYNSLIASFPKGEKLS